VDGREVPIEFFTEVRGGTAVPAPDAAVRADRSIVPALAPGVPVSTSYLVFLDEYFATAPERDRMLRSLIGQLPNLGTDDRMAVVAYNGRSVDMLSTWSSSVPALTRTLNSAFDRPAYGLQRDAERRSFDSSLRLRDRDALGQGNTGGLPVADAQLDIEEIVEAERIGEQVRRTVGAAAAALRGFANPPGRKVMMLYAGCWPYNPAQWLVSDTSRAIYTTSVLPGETLYRPLVDTANRLGYTLYAVDAVGLATPAADAALDAPRDVVAGTPFTDRERAFERELEEENALNQLARATGGRALLNSAAADAFARTVADTRSYYWLGFTPDWRGDDERYDVRVRLRDGVRGKLRARRSYSDLSRTTEVTMMVESALLFGDAPGAEALPARFGEATRAGFGKVTVPLTVAIPVHALTFLPQDADTWLAEAELRIAVRDEGGDTADIPVIPISLRGPKPPEGEGYKPYETTVRLRKRKHDVVISLYDRASGKILTSRLVIDPDDDRR
ncbi:MAG: VWA domain-containing protein, partial [Acidobacteriota bacterium]